jgi:hypothetical protein
MQTLRCPGCRRAISVDRDQRLPPWCPHCGSDFKAKAEPVRAPATTAGQPASTALVAGSPPAPVGPAGPVAVAEPPSPSVRPVRRAPPFFEGRRLPTWTSDRHLYRVYITSRDLLLIDVGSEARPANAAVVTGAVVGGLIGALVASALVGNKTRNPLADRLRELDLADERELRHIAREDAGCFAAGPDDVEELRLDGPSGWRRFFGNKHEARLTLRHRREGRLVLELPTFRDVSRATEELPKLFWEVIMIDLPFGSGARDARPDA